MSIDLAFTIGAGTVLLLGVVAGYVRNRLWLAETMICLGVGIAVGPAVLDALSPDDLGWAPVPHLEEIAHFTLGIAVMGAALRLPAGYWRRNRRDLAVALCLGLPLMAAAGAGLAHAILGLPLIYAAMVGAALSPTDPVLANSITGGRLAEANLPERTRHLLTAESGANDGLGLLLVLLPVLLVGEPLAAAVVEWSRRVFLWEVVGAVLIGAACGEAAGRLLIWAIRRPDAEGHSITTIVLALSITVLFFARMIGSDGILAVFAAGLSLKRHLDKEETTHEHTQAAIGRFFDLPVFVMFGAMLPWAEWRDLGWRGPGFALAVLALRRLPWWLMLKPLLPAVRSRTEVFFLGWFGPIGIASIYYALLVLDRTGFEEIWPIVSLVVTASIVAHGVSATPLTQLAGRMLETRPAARDEGSAEERPAQCGEAEDAGGERPARRA